MSLRSDGTHRCDKNGELLENGGVHEATVISQLDPDTGQPRVMHLCTAPRRGAPRGCTGLVLGPAAFADYYETRNA